MRSYQRPMALHRASLVGHMHHKPHQKSRTNIHESSRCPRIPLAWCLEGRQIPQYEEPSTPHVAAGEGIPSCCLICTQD